MEQKKIDTYNAGYQTPEPIEIGRWYEKVSQKEDIIYLLFHQEKEDEK